jgi:hypothetical protein
MLMKPKIPSFLITLLAIGLGLSQNAPGVTPAPDGGYPGYNTAEGDNALLSLTTGTENTAVGLSALASNRTGSFNTATGAGALLANTVDENTATGARALLNNTTGDTNTADGAFALSSNTAGNSNTAIGGSALFSNTTGNGNTANGVNALYGNANGGSNTAIGLGALIANVTGSFNTANGASALPSNTSGNRNIALGAGAGANVSTASNVICIGTAGQNVSNSCYIGQVFGALSPGGTAVFINSNGKLGTIQSSRQFKDDIKPMEQASEAIFALKPVTFHYKKGIDPQGVQQFGLVAEEVEKVNPDLVVRNADGKVYSVRYEAVDAMLLNEFLKEHRKVQEQETTISQLKYGMEALAAHLKEQDAKIQKVSAQAELSKSAPQTVLNNQ